MAKKSTTPGHTEDCAFHSDRTRCTCGRLAQDTKGTGGRDSKLTIEVQDAIVASLKDGATRVDAAVAAGITYKSMLNWEKRGEAEGAEENDNAFFLFFHAIKKAEAECANEMAKVVKTASKKSWQAAAWWLERRRRADYALRSELTGKDGAPFIPDHVAEALKRAGKFAAPKKAAAAK